MNEQDAKLIYQYEHGEIELPELINAARRDGLNEGQKHWYLYRPSKIETQMLYDWINGGMKKEAAIAFTSGPMRIIGQFCEMAKRDGAREVIEDAEDICDHDMEYHEFYQRWVEIKQKHLGGDDCSNCVSMRKRGVVGECICGKVHD